MTSRSINRDEYELTTPSTPKDNDHDHLSDDEHDFNQESDALVGRRSRSRLGTGRFSLPTRPFIHLSKWLTCYQRRHSTRPRRSCHFCRRSLFRKFVLLSYTFFAIIVVTAVIGAIFFPSYTYPPPHYTRLQHQATSRKEPGRGNLENQKIFIAASIFDRGGRLTGGDWGKNVLSLIDLLGPENTFLSIYENDSGIEGGQSLQEFEKKLKCDHNLLYEDHMKFDNLPRIRLPDGTKRVKRIAYLAEVRNRALEPLLATDTQYHKLLYLNDVMFNPVDVLQLLFSTNVDESGKANYRAACAVDFINAFKFYDTYATRDLAGYSMGVPFFPWFSAGGDETSHQDVLFGKDAVRVKSCWGGMVAFDASFFQRPEVSEVEHLTLGNVSPSNLTAPYRFRAETGTFWDASECCLIQADIQSPDPSNTGIYMNPFVRVAYDSRSLSWLGFTRRFERLYSPIHFLVDILVGLPKYNPRRDVHAWQEVQETVWMPDKHSAKGGSFQVVTRFASHTGFCGRRKLSVIKENMTTGEKNWETIPTPS